MAASGSVSVSLICADGRGLVLNMWKRNQFKKTIAGALGLSTVHISQLYAQYAYIIERPYWRQRIELAWREAPIACLKGVNPPCRGSLLAVARISSNLARSWKWPTLPAVN